MSDIEVVEKTSSTVKGSPYFSDTPTVSVDKEISIKTEEESEESVDEWEMIKEYYELMMTKPPKIKSVRKFYKNWLDLISEEDRRKTRESIFDH